MKGIRSLLERDGGCWIIPDACPDRLLPNTFGAIVGGAASGTLRAIYKILDARVGRSRAQNGWRDIDEICEALEQFGFAVKHVPLYRRETPLWCLEKLDANTADRLIVSWQGLSSLVVSLPA
jgi:hypothetical protein